MKKLFLPLKGPIRRLPVSLECKAGVEDCQNQSGRDDHWPFQDHKSYLVAGYRALESRL
jgi:hypothetical protein